ncbi:MAG: FMN-binding protein [Ruminococcus sp.]|nr:FMN-binding protein [Ruminococcus sp.]
MAESTEKTRKKSMILPPVVLAVICAVCCGLLAFANAMTKDKIAAAEADAIQSSLSELPNAGTFTEIENFTSADSDRATATGLYVDENGQAAVLITADGYNKGGLQVVVGVDQDGAVTDIAFVSNSETPGLGTKVETNPELLKDHLIGITDSSAVEEVDGVTGATYSSKALKAAVVCALDTVSANREVIDA